MTQTCRIAIFGAGSVGCYLGGRLMAAGADVTFIGRPRLQAVLAENPLLVTDFRGYRKEVQVPPDHFATEAEAARGADIVLVTVKSAATAEAGRALAPVVGDGTPVISLQNGISNAERLREALPQATVLAGMVPYNVLQKAPGHFHQGTDGQLMVAGHESLEPALPWFHRAGIPLEMRADMTSVLWSKLLLNLNNPINALSGVPLKEQLGQRSYRRCLAMAQEEALTLLEMEGIPTVKLMSLPMPWIPYLMKAPDWLFTRLAKTMTTIDPEARSSTWEDLQAGRTTEVDWINGEVVRLAERLSLRAPVNQALNSLVKEHELGHGRTWTGEALLQHLRQARDDYRPVNA